MPIPARSIPTRLGAESLSTGTSTELDTHGREAALRAPTLIREDRTHRGKCCVSSLSISSHSSRVTVSPFVALFVSTVCHGKLPLFGVKVDLVNFMIGAECGANKFSGRQSKLNFGIQYDGLLLLKRQLGADTNLRMSNDMRTERLTVSRRELLSLIGAVSGSAAMYHAMTSLGFASDSGYKGPIKLDGDPKGASVLILGAGLAGMTAALELRKAGYNVRILEFNSRAGGRNWTLRGGDSFTELGGFRQTCEFEQGLYINPGPWRIPYHHRALLDYCKRLGVVLEPFIQLNHNALLHTTRAFGGAPQRIRDIKTDFQGQISELLAKATQQGRLDEAVSKEDREILMQALRSWGALDGNYAYKANLISADFRGYAKDPGGGLSAVPIPGEPIDLSDILKSRLWRYLQTFALHAFQTTMFQPVGGMDMIGKAFAREVGNVIRYDAKVTRIQQDDR